MPPLRGARAARANRGQTDVDIMEGLPVRQWRKQPGVMNKNPQKETPVETNDQNPRWRELPMPKGSELYPPWSQALLRAARAGRILQRNSRSNDEDKDGAEDEDANGELDASFVANRWNQLSREAEEPEAEYLAKRKKGLPTLYGGWATDGGNVTMRKCKIKRFDAEGNPYLLEVLIPETTTIDGEIEEHEDIPIQAPAAGTLVEGLGIANSEGVIVANEHMMPTPPRRRPPIPKRKPKGPGRGRKKKVIIEDGANGAATAVNAATTTGSTATGAPSLNPDGTTADGQADDSKNAEGEDDADGDDGSDDEDDDGEDGDDNDNDREDGELSDGEDASRSASPVKAAAKPSSPLKAEISASLLEVPAAVPDVQVTPAASDTTRDPSPAPPSIQPPPVEISTVSEDTGENKDVLMVDAPISTEGTVQHETVGPVAGSSEIMAPVAGPPETEEPNDVSLEVEKPIEEPPTIENPQAEQVEVQAKIPEDHNPLEGFAEPQAVATEAITEAQAEKTEMEEAAADPEEVVTEKQEEQVVTKEKEEEAVAKEEAQLPEDVADTKVDDTPEQKSVTADEKPVADEDNIFSSLERHLDGKGKDA